MIYDKPPRFGMAEKNVRREVTNVLEIHGFFCYYNLQGLGSYKGIPDLCAIKDGITMYIELKKRPGKDATGKRIGAGKQSEHQRKFQDEVERHGGIYLLATCGHDVEQFIYDANLNSQKWQ